MPRVSFHSEKISFKLPNPKKTASWLEKVSVGEGRKIEELSYVFCSDAYLLRINKEYLHHSTLTDIITFDYSESKAISAEIYISIPRVRENAREFDQSFENELRRVMVHGLLHISGYKDKTVGEKAQMRLKEEASLSLWK